MDGFRCDTVPNLVEHPDFPDEKPTNAPGYTEDDRQYLHTEYEMDQPETYEIIYAWRQLLDAHSAKTGGAAKYVFSLLHRFLNSLRGRGLLSHVEVSIG